MAKSALLILALLAACSQSIDERVSAKNAAIKQLEFERRNIQASAFERRAKIAADTYRFVGSNTSQVDEEERAAERQHVDLDAISLRDVDEAISRLKTQLAEIEAERTPHRQIWTGRTNGATGKQLSWHQVVSDPEFAKQPPEIREQGRLVYFAEFVAPLVPTTDLLAAKIAFDHDTQ